ANQFALRLEQRPRDSRGPCAQYGLEERRQCGSLGSKQLRTNKRASQRHQRRSHFSGRPAEPCVEKEWHGRSMGADQWLDSSKPHECRSDFLGHELPFGPPEQFHRGGLGKQQFWPNKCPCK